MLTDHPSPSLLQRIARALARVTSTGLLIPEIDGLRFLAIGSVMLHHFISIYLPESGRVAQQVHSSAQWMEAAQRVGKLDWLVKLAYCGHFGVNLFFAISGFILALPFAKRSFARQPMPSLKQYYWRRVTRIEPPYFICLILFFLFSWLVRGAEPTAQWPHLLASMFYQHNLIYGQHSTINSVTWSLEIEIQFYLLVPLLVAVFRLRQAVLRRGLLLALIAWGGWLSQHVIYPSGNERLMLSLANFFAYFLVGFLLADLYLHGWLATSRQHWLFDGLALLAGWALVRVLTDAGQFYYSLPLLLLTLLLGCLLGRVCSAFLRLRWIVLTGGMCYTFYLYHIPLISGTLAKTIHHMPRTWPLAADLLLQALIVFPLVFVACSWWFVKTEKPFMRLSLASK